MKNYTLLVLLFVSMCSCATSQKILYLQDLEKDKTLGAMIDHQPVIKPDDRLHIVVSAPVRDVAAPYNLGLAPQPSSTPTAGANEQNPMLSYLVDEEGYIDFPVLGRIQVAGMTTRQLASLLTNRISYDVKDPTVNVSFADYRVTILGEVRAPGTYTLPGEHTTIFQALGMAGDIAITGRRKNILLLREEDGRYEFARLDLRRSDILFSPYYYLDRNDLLYVAPSRSRIQSATAPTSVISIAVSSVSLVGTLITLGLLLK
jgi:polysaccharide export outer membrane protein